MDNKDRFETDQSFREGFLEGNDFCLQVIKEIKPIDWTYEDYIGALRRIVATTKENSKYSFQHHCRSMAAYYLEDAKEMI